MSLRNSFITQLNLVIESGVHSLHKIHHILFIKRLSGILKRLMLIKLDE